MKYIKINLIEDNIIKQSTVKSCTLGLFDNLVSKRIIKKISKKDKLNNTKVKYNINCNTYAYYLQVLNKLK
jgi:hypothetical protein